jgi:hypothetical protein
MWTAGWLTIPLFYDAVKQQNEEARVKGIQRSRDLVKKYDKFTVKSLCG